MADSMKTSLQSVLPAGVYGLLRTVNQGRSIVVQRVLEALGLNVSRTNDFYSPLPSRRNLIAHRARWCRPGAMRGIAYDTASMKQSLVVLLEKYAEELKQLPEYGNITQFGPGYNETDALVLYMMIRETKPKRYLEVGSGISTYFCSLASERNAAEGRPVEITCIEPFPRKELHSIPGIHLRPREVQDEDLDIFTNLGPGDMLFIDSSHTLRIDSDIPFLFLEVLPALAPGVIVHVHDIPFPYNFPYPAEEWIFGPTWPMYWNEAMVLQAFLAFNREFQITMSLPLIRFEDEEFLKLQIPTYKTVQQQPNTFSSIWMRRL